MTLVKHCQRLGKASFERQSGRSIKGIGNSHDYLKKRRFTELW